jgi:hypothetical protein
MATTGSSKAVEAPMDDWNRRVSFDFGKNGLKEPADFKDLTVDQVVTVLVTGKVRMVRTDKEGSSFALVMDKIKLQVENKKDDLEAGFAATRTKVK